MAQRQRGRREDGCRRAGIALTGKDVEDVEQITDDALRLVLTLGITCLCSRASPVADQEGQDRYFASETEG
jgi:hypothetical protein